MEWLKDIWNNTVVQGVIIFLLGFLASQVAKLWRDKADPYLQGKDADEVVYGFIELLDPLIEEKAKDPKFNGWDIIDKIIDKIQETKPAQAAMLKAKTKKFK